MVERQLRRRGITDERVLDAMARVPRELFVPESVRPHAYDDGALPIGHGQTISQPFVVATICSLLALDGDERVLDVGTGSGYQAAVLAELAAEVVTIERIPELAETAREALADAGYANVEVRVGDGSLGVPERAPFDAIAVAAAAPTVPSALYAQLARGWAHRRPARHALGAGSRARRRARRTARSSAARSRAASSRSSATKGLGRTDRMGGGDDSARDYPAMTVESSHAQPVHGEYSPARVRAGLRKRKNWEQLVKFCVVGASGYVVNLAVFALLLDVVGLHYISAAVGSFLVAVTNNYTWNRLWTFRAAARRRRVPGDALLRRLDAGARREPRRPPRPRHARARRVRRAGDRDRARHAGELRRQ